LWWWRSEHRDLNRCGYITKIKILKGYYRWHPEKKYWSIPSSELEMLISVFNGEKLDIDPSVWLIKLEKELTARGYSPRTIKLYLYHNKRLLEFFKNNADIGYMGLSVSFSE